MNLLPTAASIEVEAGYRKARAGQVATHGLEGSFDRPLTGPRGEHHSRAHLEERSPPSGQEAWS